MGTTVRCWALWKLSLCIFLAVFTGDIEVYEFAQRSGSTILPNMTCLEKVASGVVGAAKGKENTLASFGGWSLRLAKESSQHVHVWHVLVAIEPSPS